MIKAQFTRDNFMIAPAVLQENANAAVTASLTLATNQSFSYLPFYFVICFQPQSKTTKKLVKKILQPGRF